MEDNYEIIREDDYEYERHLKLPTNIRKLLKFFFDQMTWLSPKYKRVPIKGHRATDTDESPRGLNAPFYDGAIMGGSDKPQDMHMSILPEDFLKNTDGLFPTDSNQNYCYVLERGRTDASYICLIYFRNMQI